MHAADSVSSEFFSVVICAAFSVLLLGLLIWLLLRNPQERFARAARRTSVVNAHIGETVVLVGTVETGDATISAPFSQLPCAICTAAIESDEDPRDPDAIMRSVESTSFAQRWDLKDETGTAAIRLSGKPKHFVSRDAGQVEYYHKVPMSDVDAFLSTADGGYDELSPGFPFGAVPSRLPVDYRAVEWTVRDGAAVVVVGKVCSDELSPTGWVLTDSDEFPVQVYTHPKDVARFRARR